MNRKQAAKRPRLSRAVTNQTGWVNTEGWERRGLCRQMPPEQWEVDDKPDAETLRLCLACPVVRECAESAVAMSTGSDYDAWIFGATTPAQRQSIKQGRVTLRRVWGRAAHQVRVHDDRVNEGLRDWMSGGPQRWQEAA